MDDVLKLGFKNPDGLVGAANLDERGDLVSHLRTSKDLLSKASVPAGGSVVTDLFRSAKAEVAVTLALHHSVTTGERILDVHWLDDKGDELEVEEGVLVFSDFLFEKKKLKLKSHIFKFTVHNTHINDRTTTVTVASAVDIKDEEILQEAKAAVEQAKTAIRQVDHNTAAIIGDFVEPYPADYQGIVSVLGLRRHYTYKFTGSVRAIAVRGDRVAAANISSPRHLVLFTKYGEFIREVILSSDVYSLEMDDDYNVYVGSASGLRKFDSSLNEVWNISFPERVSCTALDMQDDVIYCGTYDNTVHKITFDGDEIWKYEGFTDNVNAISFRGSRHGSGGEIYAGGEDLNVKKINVDGEVDSGILQESAVEWTSGNMGRVRAIESTLDQDIYCGGDDTIVRKISSVNGDILSEASEADGSVRGIKADQSGQVYAVGGRTILKLSKDLEVIWVYRNSFMRNPSMWVLAIDEDSIYTAAFNVFLKLSGELQVKGFRRIE